MLSNAVMFGVTLGIPLTHLSDGLQCGIPIIAWLLVFSGIYFITLIKDIIIYMVLNSSSRAKKVNQIIDLLYACIVLNFQVAWLIYGNTFIYSDAAIACRDATQGTNSLWILMIVIIAFGYVYFIIYGLLCCCLACLVCMGACFRPEIAGNQNTFMSRLPYMEAIQSLNKKRFDNVEVKSMTECVICMIDFS